MTLGTILADCYRRLNYPTSPDSVVSTRLTAFANETMDELVSRPGVAPRVLHRTIQLNSVANQAEYALPSNLGRTIKVVDTTNQYPLIQVTEDYYRTIQPNQTQITGTPTMYCDLGMQFTALRPSAAGSAVYIKSTSASDTGTCYFEFIRLGGQTVVSSVVMTGVTAVQLGTATDVVQVTNLYLSAAAVGSVTLNETSGAGTELSQIPIGSTSNRYQTIALIITPASVLPYTLQGEGILVPLVNTNDEPVLPAQFHRLVGTGVRKKEAEYKDDASRRVMTTQEWERGLGELNEWLVSGSDMVYIPGRVTGQPSVLGPWTPSPPYRSGW